MSRHCNLSRECTIDCHVNLIVQSYKKFSDWIYKNRHVSTTRVFWKIGVVTLIIQIHYNNQNDNNHHFAISGRSRFLTEV